MATTGRTGGLAGIVRNRKRDLARRAKPLLRASQTRLILIACFYDLPTLVMPTIRASSVGQCFLVAVTALYQRRCTQRVVCAPSVTTSLTDFPLWQRTHNNFLLLFRPATRPLVYCHANRNSKFPALASAFLTHTGGSNHSVLSMRPFNASSADHRGSTSSAASSSSVSTAISISSCASRILER